MTHWSLTVLATLLTVRAAGADIINVPDPGNGILGIPPPPPPPVTPSCPTDTNADGIVDVDDLIAVILTWGMVCP